MNEISSTIPPAYQAEGVTKQQWTDWRWQLTNTIKTVDRLLRYAKISPARAAEIQQVITTEYQNGRDEMRLTPYLISLINFNDPNDPIAQQHLPAKAELTADDFSFDTVWERSDDFLDGNNRMFQKKYPDVVLLRLANTCHSFCRFCFEKERTLRHGVPTAAGPNEFAQAVKLITEDRCIRTVLLSGGDPLIVPDDILMERIKTLAAIPHIVSIRLNTRALLHNPFRVTPEFAKLLGAVQRHSWETKTRGVELRLGVHFNHPRELTPEALRALHYLQREDIHVYNQTVILRGINDQAEIIIDLFKKLRQENVELHYLSHAMTVPRTGHLRTSVRTVQNIMHALKECKEFRGQLPYAELSHYTGKQLIPDSMNEWFYEDVLEKDGKKIPIIRFLSHITGQWEVWLDGKE